jgi:hypothetical protein
LISCFPVMLLRYFMNDFVVFPVVIITCITFVFFTPDTLCFYCKVLVLTCICLRRRCIPCDLVRLTVPS